MPRTAALAFLALVAFAANSLLARAALLDVHADPAYFTLIRLFSGALMLVILSAAFHPRRAIMRGASPVSALALLAYAGCFSFAYQTLETGAGALILFAAVQITMIGGGLIAGRWPDARQWLGIVMAFSGLLYYLSPGIGAPDLAGAMMMALAGAAWGLYSLRPQRAGTPLSATCGNFILACLIGAPVLILAGGTAAIERDMVGLAVISGAVTSGIGYAIWYAALERLNPLSAAVSQLSVPLIAAVAGILVLAEPVHHRLLLATPIILGGIAIVALRRSRNGTDRAKSAE